jgi:hypothetical protein
MRRLLLSLLALSVAVALPAWAQEKKKKEPVLPPDSIYKLKAKTLDGKDADLKDYAGKVTLIVNLASQ